MHIHQLLLRKDIRFYLLGGTLFLATLIANWIGTNLFGFNEQWVFAIVGIVALELNFLFSKIIWRDRGGSLMSQLITFHIVRWGTYLINLQIFGFIVPMDILPNTVLIAMLALLDMFLHLWANEFLVFVNVRLK